MSDSVWKLKVMSGSHKGVELQLPFGKTTLGSDDLRADLVIDNQGLDSVHLLFELSEDGALYVSVMADNSDVNINGHVLDRGSSGVKGSALIKTEELTLAVVEGDQPWPEESMVSPVETAPSEETESEKNVSASVAEDTDNVESEAKPGNKRIHFWPKALPIRKLSIAASILVLFTFTAVLGLRYGQAQSDTRIVLTSLEKGQQLIKKMNFSSVKLTCNKSKKRIEISGYVESERDKRKLLTQLKALGISYKGRVWVMERIVRSVEFSLEELGFKNIHASAGSEMGTVVLKGSADDRHRWPDLETMLDNDIPGLVSWKVDFSSSEDRLAAFGKMLAAAGLGNKLQLQGNGDNVQALGLLDKHEEREFYKTAESFRQVYGYTPQLQAYPRRLDTGTLPVKGISLSDVPFLVMENNQKYLIGAKLPNGYQVDEITSKGITMSKGADTVYFSLESKSNEQQRSTPDDQS